jgi:hypothetical protein
MADKYVSHSGDDGNDGSSGSPYRTIQKAIDEISTGDTAWIKADETYELETVQNGTAGEVKTGELNRFYVDAGVTPSSSYIGKNIFVDDGTVSDSYGYKITAAQGQAGGYYTVSRDFSGTGSNLTWRVGDQGATTIDMDGADGKALKGYYQNTGDQDCGGAKYKDANNGWVVLDLNNGAFQLFNVGDNRDLRWGNFKVTNANSGQDVFVLLPANEQYGYLLQNIRWTGGRRGIYMNKLGNPIIRDCKFTGTYSASPVFGIVHFLSACNRGAIIEACEFAHGNAARAIYAQNQGMNVICNNIFNISGTVTDVINIVGAAAIFNNVIYENGGTITDGIELAGSAKSCGIWNNIIVGCANSINDPADVNFGGWNCFYNNTNVWTLRDGDIQADPQFVDAANGDFRLKPISPCLNTGKPTANGGFTSIGAWQRKSLLRWR